MTLLDPEELPFTRDELYEALSLFMPETTAGRVADHFAEIAPDFVAHREALQAAWARDGASPPQRIGGWVYPDELLPALYVLSPETAQRTKRLVEAQWADRRRARLNKARDRVVRERDASRQEPAALEASLRAIILPEDRRKARQGLAIGAPDLPEVPPEMLALIDAELLSLRTEWEQQVTVFQQRKAARDNSAAG